jgi:hypothetical protein
MKVTSKIIRKNNIYQITLSEDDFIELFLSLPDTKKQWKNTMQDSFDNVNPYLEVNLEEFRGN